MPTLEMASAPARPALSCPVCGSAASEPWAQGWDAEYLLRMRRSSH